MKRPRFRMLLALTIAILAVSTASVLIRLAQVHATSITIASLRLALATVLLSPLVWARHRAALRTLGRRQLVLAGFSGAFLALHFGTWISSLEYTSVASSVVLVSTGPLWVAMLSPLLLDERVGRAAVVGLALAIIGGIIISFGDACDLGDGLRCASLGAGRSGEPLRGNVLALVGAWAVSGYLMIGRRLRTELSLVPYIFVVYGFAALTLLAAAWATGGLQLRLPAMTYVWIFLLAVVPQLIGHSTYNWALGYLPAALVAVATLGEPVGSALLAYVILAEVPGPAVIAGGILILTGIYLATRSAIRQTAPTVAQVHS